MEESQREAWLRDVCGSEAELHAEVQSLLEWHRDSTGFLEGSVARVAELPVSATFEQPPRSSSANLKAPGASSTSSAAAAWAWSIALNARTRRFSGRRRSKVVRFGRHSASIVERFRRAA